MIPMSYPTTGYIPRRVRPRNYVGPPALRRGNRRRFVSERKLTNMWGSSELHRSVIRIGGIVEARQRRHRDAVDQSGNQARGFRDRHVGHAEGVTGRSVAYLKPDVVLCFFHRNQHVGLKRWVDYLNVSRFVDARHVVMWVLPASDGACPGFFPDLSATKCV